MHTILKVSRLPFPNTYSPLSPDCPSPEPHHVLCVPVFSVPCVAAFSTLEVPTFFSWKTGRGDRPILLSHCWEIAPAQRDSRVNDMDESTHADLERGREGKPGHLHPSWKLCTFHAQRIEATFWFCHSGNFHLEQVSSKCTWTAPWSWIALEIITDEGCKWWGRKVVLLCITYYNLAGPGGKPIFQVTKDKIGQIVRVWSSVEPVAPPHPSVSRDSQAVNQAGHQHVQGRFGHADSWAQPHSC